MLKPEDFVAGSFPEAAEDLTLILPRRAAEHRILITGATGDKIAVYLDRPGYEATPCGDSRSRKGLVVPNVRIQVDETSLFDPDDDDAPFGALVREGRTLSVISRTTDGYHPSHAEAVCLVNDLPPCADRVSVGFRRWSILLGEGEACRTLATVEAAPSSSS
jgi:hypothetical protein